MGGDLKSLKVRFCLKKIEFFGRHHLGVVSHILPAICVAAELIENIDHLNKALVRWSRVFLSPVAQFHRLLALP